MVLGPLFEKWITALKLITLLDHHGEYVEKELVCVELILRVLAP